MRPWHHNVARSLVKAPKVYFFDTGLVRGDEGVRFENAVATMLLKALHWRYDVLGESVDLHYLRTRDETEVDFAVSRDGQLVQLVECKLTDSAPHRALVRFAAELPQAQAIQLVRHLRNAQSRDRVDVVPAEQWLRDLAA